MTSAYVLSQENSYRFLGVGDVLDVLSFSYSLRELSRLVRLAVGVAMARRWCFRYLILCINRLLSFPNGVDG